LESAYGLPWFFTEEDEMDEEVRYLTQMKVFKHVRSQLERRFRAVAKARAKSAAGEPSQDGKS